MNSVIFKSIVNGLAGTLALLALYFGISTLLSGWAFASSQFSIFWYYLISLAVGFGIQVGLYSYLIKAVHSRDGSGKVIAVSGTTSTVAMVSCCSHYLLNILPFVAVSGVISLLAQYQVEIFWIGLAANAFGIFYVANKIIQSLPKLTTGRRWERRV